jgi:ubiquinone/menaquinone biosynthesis C-methylase UbiE
MDALGLRAGSAVADVGCGDGYFVFHLARRVGRDGRVYGVDVDEAALRRLRRRVEQEGFEQVRIVHGKPDDPLLPADALDAALIVNAYHEMRESDAMLRGIFAALRPGGRLAIIDAAGDEDADRAALMRRHQMSEKLARDAAARNGFRFLSQEPGFERTDSSRRRWFFLLFEKPPA